MKHFPLARKNRKYIVERETLLTLRRPDSGVVSTDKESAILFSNRRKMPLTTSTQRSTERERGQWGLIGYFWEATSSSWKTISDTWFLNNILGFKFYSGTNKNKLSKFTKFLFPHLSHWDNGINHSGLCWVLTEHLVDR